MVGRWRNSLAIGSIVLVTFVGGIALYSMRVPEHCNPTNLSLLPSSERMRIASCLARNGELMGMKYEEVLAHIGSPRNSYITYESKNRILIIWLNDEIVQENSQYLEEGSILKGTTRSDVLKRLGQPDKEQLGYDLNPEARTFGVDLSHEKVNRVVISRHGE